MKISMLVVLGLLLSGCGSSDPSSGVTTVSTSTTSGCTTASTGFYGGSGSISDPYTICSATQLANMRLAPTLSSFSLLNSINMNGVMLTLSNNVVKNFNGNNFTISNYVLHDTVDTTDVGFIGSLTGSFINTTFTSVDISSIANFTGIIGVVNGGTVSNITTTNTLTIDGFLNTGCLTGASISGIISNVNVYCTLTTTSTSNSSGMGGIAAFMNGGTITNSTSGSTMTGAYFEGGVAGSTTGASISGSHSLYNMTGKGDVGGLVGFLDSTSSISSSTAAGTIHNNNNGPVSGTIAAGTGTATSCSFSGPTPISD